MRLPILIAVVMLKSGRVMSEGLIRNETGHQQARVDTSRVLRASQPRGQLRRCRAGAQGLGFAVARSLRQ